MTQPRRNANTTPDTMTTQQEIRQAFWETFPYLHRSQTHTKNAGTAANGRTRRARKTQNDYNATTRSAFVDYVDNLHRDGTISEALANRATL